MTPAELASLHALCFATPRPWREAEFADLLSDKSVHLETASTGFLLWRSAGTEAELLTLAVDPAKRRVGTGRLLVRRFLDAARTGGAAEAFLEVAADNTAARALYTDEGFVEVGTRPRYYARPDATMLDAIVLRADLGG